MPSYRGVDKAEIKNSIRHAVARLQEWDVGDATREMIDVWKMGAPYETIDMAANEYELAVMMDISNTKSLFTKLSTVFRYHAALGVTGEGPKSDQKIYKDLVSWGAFVPPDKPDETWMAVQDEATQYMLKKCLDRLAPEDCEPGSAAYQIFKEALASVKTEDPEAEKWRFDTEKWFRESVPMYIFLHSINEDNKIAELLDQMPKINDFMIRTLYRMTGLPAEESKIELNSPLRYYRAMAPYPGEQPGETVRGTFNENARDRARAHFMDSAMDEVIGALEPFFQTDNAAKKVTGRDITDAGSCALFFLSTREAAQAVADKLDYQVFDAGDKQILPTWQQDLPPPSLQQ